MSASASSADDSRPRRSPAGFRRRVQISRYSLHIVVEGQNFDSAYYGLIAEGSSSASTLGYVITRIDTIGLGGGKASVLKLFGSMKRSGHLIQRVSSGTRVVVFMLDRDAERVLGGSKRSPHVYYTNGYDVESDIISHGSDFKALSWAASLAPIDSREIARRLSGWRSHAAELWRDWLFLCCVSHKLGVACEATFKSKSKINLAIFGSVQTGEYERIRRQILTRSGLSAIEFEIVEQTIQRRLEKLYSRGDGELLVKGKWYPAYLKYRLASEKTSSGPVNARDLEKVAVTSYLASLDVSDVWATRYIAGFDRLLTVD